MNIILIGAPASGKGTLSAQLTDIYDIKTASAGDLLRTEIENRTEIGIRIEELLSQGKFAPSEITNSIMETYLKEHAESDLVLDGYPRNEEQAAFCDKALEDLDQCVDMALIIDVDQDVATKRILNRRMCPECKRIGTAEDGGVCPACGATQTMRDDDTEETARERFETYHKTTEPIIAHYEALDSCQVVYVDGNGSADNTLAQVRALLDGKLPVK